MFWWLLKFRSWGKDVTCLALPGPSAELNCPHLRWWQSRRVLTQSPKRVSTWRNARTRGHGTRREDSVVTTDSQSYFENEELTFSSGGEIAETIPLGAVLHYGLISPKRGHTGKQLKGSKIKADEIRAKKNKQNA